MFFELEKSYLGGGVLHPEWSHTSQPVDGHPRRGHSRFCRIASWKWQLAASQR